MSSTAVRRSVRMSLVAIVVALTSLVVVDADRADAHSSLVSSTPSDGQTLTEPLDRVDLTFSEAPLAGLDAGLRIEVRDAAGQDVSTGDVTVDGLTMSKAVEPTNGSYTMLWRYVSPDGHPITGELAFTVDLPVSTSTGSPTASTEPGSDATEIDVTLEADAAPTAGDDTPSTWPVLVAGGVGIVLIAAILVAASRRRRVPTDD